MLVGVTSDGAELLFEVRVNVLIQPDKAVSWRCVVQLASMPQSDQPVWFALNPWRALIPQSNLRVLFFLLLLYVYILQGYNLFFLLYQYKRLVECGSSKKNSKRRYRLVPAGI